MKKNQPPSMFRPFKNLDKLLDGRTIPRQAPPGKHPKVSLKNRSNPIPVEDKQLFKEAMKGVVPLDGNKCGDLEPKERSSHGSMEQDSPCDTLNRLEQLVSSGRGFVVADTPEYIEGAAPRVHPDITRHLHSGRFSIQAYIDLHGLTVAQARGALNEFLKEAITTGKRAVSIVHGRGLSSPREPVLKTRVYQWLTTGTWRKWVIAFSSAPAWDGGAGATYVLLRQRPMTKSHWKKRNDL